MMPMKNMTHASHHSMTHPPHHHSTMGSGHEGHGGHGGHGENGTGNGMHDMMMMQMWFYVGEKAVILFKSWNVTTAGEMFGSCAALFFLSILYEGLKIMREVLKRKLLSYSNHGMSLLQEKCLVHVLLSSS